MQRVTRRGEHGLVAEDTLSVGSELKKQYGVSKYQQIDGCWVVAGTLCWSAAVQVPVWVLRRYYNHCKVTQSSLNGLKGSLYIALHCLTAWGMGCRMRSASLVRRNLWMMSSMMAWAVPHMNCC